MEIILFDDESRQSLLPLTHTRPVSEIRIGILRIREKWEIYFHGNYSYLTEPFLSKKFQFLPGKENLFINGSILPVATLVLEIQKLDRKSVV